MVGRSLVIGKPVAMLLLARNATVTICHTHTRNLAEECQKADVLIVAAGKAGAVDGRCISQGQVVIDVGIHVSEDGTMDMLWEGKSGEERNLNGCRILIVEDDPVIAGAMSKLQQPSPMPSQDRKSVV